ncbi:MAG: histidine kinase [Hyphomicrobiales bacterium]|jgi:hypothetical protein|nr:histidine kinase [Methylobacterium sp.]MCA3652833.1 histidine kinase [Methylobacterium sp.]MCA4923297.1 histidine kinase [Methylobacterium sp.]MCE2932309.1 histidine kinase [Hyphomicrobiales bacterium]
MGLLLRVLVGLALMAGLLYGVLHALGTLVEPEPRDIVVPVPMPRVPAGNPGG